MHACKNLMDHINILRRNEKAIKSYFQAIVVGNFRSLEERERCCRTILNLKVSLQNSLKMFLAFGIACNNLSLRDYLKWKISRRHLRIDVSFVARFN